MTVPMPSKDLRGGNGGVPFPLVPQGKNAATRVIRFSETLKIPEGPLHGRALKLPTYLKDFVRGALRNKVRIAVMSIGRGNAKTAGCAVVAVAELVGVIVSQPRREVIIAARNRDQGGQAFNFCRAFVDQMIEDGRLSADEVHVRRGNGRLEIEWDGDGGGHVIRVIAADGKSSLGGAPTLILMDERGFWELDKGNELENALLTGLHKRRGRALIISTSAPNDAHPFSVWLDQEQEGVFRVEHRPPEGLPADDLESLKVANPGYRSGIVDIKELQQDARRAIKRGGSALTKFRLLNRNERVSDETRDVLLTVDEWLACEVTDMPSRLGDLVVGIDLGGSASMSAAAFYWPETGRLEAIGTFPSIPGLADRGANDGVRDRYMEMHQRGELNTLGGHTVPIAPWLKEVLAKVADQPITALVMDRFKQAEIGEAIDNAGIRAPIIWRGMGYKDGGEDCERFQRAAYDGKVQSAPSLLLRSAFADAVILRDPANNMKLAKARSNGRIDAAAAAVLAVAEGSRILNRPIKGGRVAWS